MANCYKILLLIVSVTFLAFVVYSYDRYNRLQPPEGMSPSEWIELEKARAEVRAIRTDSELQDRAKWLLFSKNYNSIKKMERKEASDHRHPATKVN